MERSRRVALRRIGTWMAAGAAIAETGLLPARASTDWPTKPVRVVYSYPPGGTGEVAVRMITAGLAKIWGQSVVVENRPGAGGMIGTEAVAKAPPDGHTLLFALTGLVQMPALYGKAPFDPIRDFAPVVEIGTAQWVLVAQPDLPVRNLGELLEYVARLGKPQPYGTYALGSAPHIQIEVLARKLRLQMTHVPYKGEAPLLQDLLGGQVPIGAVAATTAQKYTDRLRPIAVAGAARSPLLPDLPTFAEAGHRGMERQGFVGVLAPAGTPQATVEKISADLNRVLFDPAVQPRLAEMGFILKGGTPSAFAETVRTESAYWQEVVRETGIKLER